MPVNRVYFRGCGAVSALGSAQDQIANACRSGHATPGFTVLPHSCAHYLPFYSILGEIDAPSSPNLYRHIDAAVDSAIEDAALRSEEIEGLPVFVGSTACDISDLEEQYQRALQVDVNAAPLYRSGFGVLAGYVIDRLRSRGQEFSFNTACSSSANALLVAARMIAHGRMDNALVLGVETRNQMSLQGFSAMMLLSSKGSRPFDKYRDGTVLGEGVGAIVLSRHKPTSSKYAAQRPYYCLGGANLTDSTNITSSSAELIAAVMQRSLEDTELAPKDINFVKAHGTSTPANDKAEAQGMRLIFRENVPPITSLKPYIGHTLGACGAMEAIVLLACTKENFIPGTPGFSAPDESFDLAPVAEAQAFSGGNIMLNYFGFGGNNASLVISNRI